MEKVERAEEAGATRPRWRKALRNVPGYRDLVFEGDGGGCSLKWSRAGGAEDPLGVRTSLPAREYIC